MKSRYIAIACILACLLVFALSSPLSGIALAKDKKDKDKDTQQQSPTGSNVDPKPPVSFSWPAFGLTTKYQFVLAKDPAFKDIVVDTEVETTAYKSQGALEYSTSYFWRTKALEPEPGNWSATFSFQTMAKPAVPTPTMQPYPGPQLLSPTNGYIGTPVKPASFSWSPYKEATKYQFVLAKDGAMTQIVKEANVTTTTYEYDGTLEPGRAYFWRVKAVEPTPSDWSATFAFQTAGAPAAPPPPGTGMSCSQASIGYPAASVDLSPSLLGMVLLGLVFANRWRASK